jgi:hypothetical protein
VEFVETSVFNRFVKREFGEDNLRALQSELIDTPDLGRVIQRSGGARKVRWGGKGVGKSGGYRIIYFFSRSEDRCYLLIGFKKGEQENLSEAQLNSLREYIKEHLK